MISTFWSLLLWSNFVEVGVEVNPDWMMEVPCIHVLSLQEKIRRQKGKLSALAGIGEFHLIYF